MTRRFGLLTLALVCPLLVAGLVARPSYRHYKEKRATQRARDFLERGELASASLCARQALALNGTNSSALEIMAQVAEVCAPPQALDWRQRIVAIAPTLENRLGYAAAALRVEGRPYGLASSLLEELRPLASNRVAYCNLAADLAVKLGNPARAETWIEAAGRLQPSNQLHQLNLAVLRLNSTNAARAAEARAVLNQLRTNTNFAIPALRLLVMERLARGDVPGATTLSSELALNPRSALQDRLQHLDILHAARLPEFDSYLSQMQREVSTNPPAIYELSSLLLRRGMAGQVRRWLEGCPAAIQRSQPVQLALVECEFSLKDWQAAERRLERERWEEFEPMRLALVSQAAFELGNRTASELRWRLAVSRARGRLGSLMWLAAKAEAWGRESARLELLVEISAQFPSQRWALDELAQAYLARGDTRALHQVCSRLSALAPADVSVRNDFANTAFLLKTNLAKAHEMARELFHQCPDNPTIASTYAYSLYLQGRTNEALAVFGRLGQAARTNAGIALYYSAVLRAHGQTAEARECSIPVDQASLLPEERALLSQLTSP